MAVPPIPKASPPKPPGAGAGTASREVEDFAERLREATDDLSTLQLADLAESGQHHVSPQLDPVDHTAVAAAPANADARPPAPPAAASPAGASPPMHGGPAELQLDTGPREPAAQQGEAPPAALMHSTPGTVVPLAAYASGASYSYPPPRPRSLFGTDRIAGFLIATGIGLAVGILPAMRWSRSLLETLSAPALVELEQSIEHPLAVRAGQLRTPAEIANELATAEAPAISRFWWVWLGIALPVALGLGIPTRRE